jgi:hypothetical protein
MELGKIPGVDAPVLHGDTTTDALERWLGPGAGWEPGRQALATDALVVWICAPPETGLIDAQTIEWRAARRYGRGFDAFVPAPLRSEPPAELHLAGTGTDGALAYLGRAHLAAYGRSDSGSHGEAQFVLLEPLPRALWLRLGGFAGVRLEADGVHEDVEAAAVAGVVAASEREELWLRRWTGETLTVLFESERAFVMELSGPAGVGAVACDPASAGQRRPVAFTLSNGQVDEWPLEGTISRAQALEAVAAWAQGRRAASLIWTEDPR